MSALNIAMLDEDVPAPEIVTYDLGFKVRPALRLSFVEQIIEVNRILRPVPSRLTLIKMISSGELQGKKWGSEFIVYEDSFLAWARELSAHAQ